MASCTSMLLSRSSFSLFTKISNHKFPKLPFRRTFCSAATTTTSNETLKHSLLLDRLRSRHLKDAPKSPRIKIKPNTGNIPTISSIVEMSESKSKKVDGGFEELGLSEEVMNAIKEMGIEEPTEIQSIGVPAVLDGKSVVLGSHTGSGKTLAYLLPLVQLLRRDEELYGMMMKPRRPRAVVLCPTRELCEQVFRVSKAISHHARFRSTRISGGGRLRPQEDSLNVPIDMVKMPSLLFLCLLLLPLTFSPATSLSDAPTTFLNKGCSQYNASDLSLNSTFSNLRSQLSNSSLFATSHTTPANSNTPIYSMFYCRPYLSLPSCLSCFANASATIRTCGFSNGARVILNGCFLRYETAPFYDQTTLPGNFAICSNASSNSGPEVASLMADLAAVTNRVNGYFAAAVRNGVYGVAECVQTVSASGCNDCLQVAVANVRGCLGKKEGTAVDAGCFLRFSDADFFGDYHTVNLQSLLSSPSGKSSNKGAIIGGVVGGCLLILFALLLFLWLRKSKKSKVGGRGNILGATELRGPVNFRYKDLKSATKNFSDENKLGEGGFGDVYKGALKNGNIVAVKKLAISQTSRAKADFQSEVTLISNVHHRNLVRLLGCSSKGPDLLLVYEYMANSSLDKFLFGEKRGTLNWKQRFDIIVGIARGIAYLHQEFHVTVIHRDIKSSNILLDDDLQPKIADFGLARLLPGDQTHVSTKFAGTLGYTAPEYAIHGQLSEKVDTYSYGVVLLEIISGRKSNDPRLELEYQYLLEWAWRLYESRELVKLVDESMDPNEFNEDELKRVIEIALLCTQSIVAARPTMSEVVILLLSKASPSVVPTRPTFIDAVNRVRGDTDTSTSNGSSAPSNATVSFTQMSAR